MPLRCDLHSNYIFPHVICKYGDILTPSKLIFLHLTGGEQPVCRSAQAMWFYKVMKMTLNQKAVPVTRAMGFLPPSTNNCLAETQAGPSGPLPPPPVEFLQRGREPYRHRAPGHHQVRIWGGAGVQKLFFFFPE